MSAPGAVPHDAEVIDLAGGAGTEEAQGTGEAAGTQEAAEAARLRLFDLRVQEAAFVAALATRDTLVHLALLDFLR